MIAKRIIFVLVADENSWRVHPRDHPHPPRENIIQYREAHTVNKNVVFYSFISFLIKKNTTNEHRNINRIIQIIKYYNSI